MAAPFQFRLAAVLCMRRMTLETRQRAVANRLARIHDAESASGRLHRRIDEQLDAARAALSARAIQVEQVVWDRHLIGRMRRELAETVAAIEEHQRQLVGERRELAEAHKAVKTLERLEERQREAHRVEQARRERIEDDERTTLRHRFAASQGQMT